MTHFQYYKRDDYNIDHYSRTLSQKSDAAYSQDAKIQYQNTDLYIYRVSQEEWTKLREGVPYVKLYRYNPKHLCPKLNGY